jgi:hypothetical protein
MQHHYRSRVSKRQHNFVWPHIGKLIALELAQGIELVTQDCLLKNADLKKGSSECLVERHRCMTRMVLGFAREPDAVFPRRHTRKPLE